MVPESLLPSDLCWPPKFVARAGFKGFQAKPYLPQKEVSTMSPEHVPFAERKEFPYKVPLILSNDFPPEEQVLKDGSKVNLWDLDSLTRSAEERSMCGLLQVTFLSSILQLTPASPLSQVESVLYLNVTYYLQYFYNSMGDALSFNSDLSVGYLQTSSLEQDSCQENQRRSKQNNKILKTQMGKSITEFL